MPRVFISYRREDAAADAGRIADRLRERFGARNVFLDEGIQGGAIFPEVIRNQINQCDVLLVIIGARWLTITNPEGSARRLDKDDDWVRLEVEGGLKRKIRVIPVLVQGAKIPTEGMLPDALKELTQRNAVEVREGAGFGYDMDALIDTLCGGRRWVVRLNKPAVWLSTTAALCLIGVIWLRVGRMSTVPAPEDFRMQLRMRLEPHFGPVDKAPTLKLRQLSPRDWGTNELTPGTQTGAAEYEYQPQSITMPVGEQQYRGDLHREVQSGALTSKPDWVHICFRRKANTLTSDPIVRLTCAEGSACQVSADDYGWAKSCSSNAGLRWLIPTALAQSQPREPLAGWEVPSIQTLRRQEASKQKPAFTEFVLKSAPLPGWEGADRLTYAIHVNGAPVYIDGLPPDSVPFEAGKGINVVFGLENLDFSGEHAGYEDIELKLQFTKNGATIKHATIHLRYIALRPMPENPATVDQNFEVKWQAAYHPGRRDDVYQIFLLSTLHANDASDQKHRIDAAKITIESLPVVAVVRPPIERNRSYGVALGVRQPSGQVKFTFDDDMSKKLCRGVIRTARNSRLISTSAFRRDVEHRGASAACSTF